MPHIDLLRYSYWIILLFIPMSLYKVNGAHFPPESNSMGSYSFSRFPVIADVDILPETLLQYVFIGNLQGDATHSNQEQRHPFLIGRSNSTPYTQTKSITWLTIIPSSLLHRWPSHIHTPIIHINDNLLLREKSLNRRIHMMARPFSQTIPLLYTYRFHCINDHFQVS
jgi:hypothetical protein